MSLSLGIGLGLTHKHDHNWWDAFRVGGFEATLVLSFKTKQYYNQTQKTLAELVESARSTTKSAWDVNGDIVSLAANTPVIAYDPVTKARLGVVSEPAINRINIYPECKDGTGWIDEGVTSTNLSLSALGVFDGVSISSDGNAFARLRPTTAVSIVSGSVYPIAMFYRAGTSGSALLRIRDLVLGDTNIYGTVGSLAVQTTSAGTVSDFTEILLEDGVTWRVSFYLTAAGSNTLQTGIGPFSTTSGETVIALGAFIGAAGEKLPHCPIVGSDGSTVTTNADDLSTVVDGSDPYTGYDQTKVSGKITLTPNADGALDYISYNDGTANEVIKVHQDASNNIRLTVTDGGVVQCDIDSLVNAVIGTEVTIAFRAAANDFAISVDGSTEQTDGAGTMPTITQHDFGGVGLVVEEVAYNEVITDLAGLSA